MPRPQEYFRNVALSLLAVKEISAAVHSRMRSIFESVVQCVRDWRRAPQLIRYE
jgi:hypothetical protein